MERQRYSDEDLIEREIAEQTESPDPPEETEIERRSGPSLMHEVDQFPPRGRNEAMYSDTDTDPTRDDQGTAHRAEDDQHL